MFAHVTCFPAGAASKDRNKSFLEVICLDAPLSKYQITCASSTLQAEKSEQTIKAYESCTIFADSSSFAAEVLAEFETAKLDSFFFSLAIRFEHSLI